LRENAGGDRQDIPGLAACCVGSVSGCGFLSADSVAKLANSVEESAVNLAPVAVEVSVLDVGANSVEQVSLI